MFNMWCIVNISVFTVLLFFPFHNFSLPNMITVTEDEICKEAYKESYIDFHNDYERSNPITKRKGFENYFEAMFNAGEIDEHEYRSILEELKKEDNFFDEYFRNSCSFSLFKQNNQKREYCKRINQYYFDHFWNTPQSNIFTDKAFLHSLLCNNVYSSIKNRHNKVRETKGRIFIQEKTFRTNQIRNNINNNMSFADQDASIYKKSYDLPDANRIDFNKLDLEKGIESDVRNLNQKKDVNEESVHLKN